MTAIVAKKYGDAWHFACDGRIQSDDVKLACTGPKWIETRGWLFATAGDCPDAAKLANFLHETDSLHLLRALNTFCREEDLDVTLIAHPPGADHVYLASCGYAHKHTDETVCGSGADVAFGALAHGATPLEAVKTAGTRLCSVGAPYYSLVRPITAAPKGR